MESIANQLFVVFVFIGLPVLAIVILEIDGRRQARRRAEYLAEAARVGCPDKAR